ncbi:restriction endonuclease subunit S [Aeromonas rivipollensis]|uniref:restriction endonuclease subunit S n=1 Tax=Aeromonas rivipollensis TaxID=948519 RepID=UPI0038D0C2E5
MSSEWPLVRIEDIAANQPSAMATGPFGSSISAKFFQESGIPVIRGSNLSADVQIKIDDSGLVFVSKDKAKEFPRCIVSNGDLVFTCWGTINQVGLIDDTATYQKYLISNKQMKLTVDRTKADPRFVYYVFSGPTKQSEIIENGIGSSVPGFNLGQLRKHSFRLPPLEEQQAIADLLDIFSNRIALLRETNATLEAIAQALFKSWFVDFDPVHARARGEEPIGLSPEVAALFPASFEESALGMIPEGWLPTMLGDVCKFQKGCSYKGAGLSNDSGAYMFNLGCFNGPRIFAFENIKRYTGDYKPRHEVVAGDLIVANTDMTQMRDILGRPLIVPSGYEKAFISHHVFRVEFPRLEEQKLLRNFLFFAFGLPEFRERAVGFATGTTVLGLPKDALDGYQMVVPAKEVLAAFNKVCEPILAKIEANHHKAQILATLRDTLLPRLISGQLQLPKAEDVLHEAGI